MDTPTRIIRKTSPYLRRPNANVTRMMTDVTIALLPVSIFSVYTFGLSALWIILLGIGSMMITEYIYYQVQDLLNGESLKIKNKSFTLHNGSVLTSGLIYALTLPDSTPWYVVVIGGVLGIYLAKLIFGGMGQNIFNPAAVARVLVVVIYATHINYVQHVPVIDGVAGATPLSIVNDIPFTLEALQHYSFSNLLIGTGLPGSIGEVSAILLLLGGIYLAVRTSFEVRIPLAMISTVALLSLSVSLFVGINPIQYMMFHVFSGGLLFGAIYMATDPITSPITKPGRIAAGFMIGALTFIIRIFGAMPEGVVFSILIMNMFVSSFDYYKWTNSQFKRKRVVWFSVVVLITIAVVLVGVHYAK